MIARVARATFLTASVLAFSATGTAYVLGEAHAQPSQTVNVDGTEYPVCHVEDCSDVPDQRGVWFDPDTGLGWLSQGAASMPIDALPHCINIGCGLGRLPGPSY